MINYKNNNISSTSNLFDGSFNLLKLGMNMQKVRVLARVMVSNGIIFITLLFICCTKQETKIVYNLKSSVQDSINNYIVRNDLDIKYCFIKDETNSYLMSFLYSGNSDNESFIIEHTNRYVRIKGIDIPVVFPFDDFSLRNNESDSITFKIEKSKFLNVKLSLDGFIKLIYIMPDEQYKLYY